jgi:hypothetical protein
MGKYVPPQHRSKDPQTHHAPSQAFPQEDQQSLPSWEDLPDLRDLRWSDLIEDEMEIERPPPPREEGEWVTIKKKNNRGRRRR